MFDLLNNKCVLTLFLFEVYFTPHVTSLAPTSFLPPLLGSTYPWDTMAGLPPLWYLAPQSEDPWDR